MSKTTITYKDIAPGADRVSSFSSTQQTEFSDLSILSQENEPQRIATLEHNRWLLNGEYYGLANDTVPFWTRDLSGDDCAFSVPQVIEVTFPSQFSSPGLTIQFDDAPGEIASELNIKWYQQDELKAEGDFCPNESQYYCQQKAESWDRIVITFRKTWLPRHRVKLRQIIFGVVRKFGMNEIRNATVTNQMNLLSTEVPVSTLNWTLDSLADIDYMFQVKQPVEVKNDDFIIGYYYINESRRTSKSVYTLRCHDAFGILDEDDFEGGVYSEYSAMQLMKEIINEDFEIDFGTVKDMLLTGVLQTMSKRAAIQQILFAWGVCAATDGGEVIRVFEPGSDPEEIGLDRTYTGVAVETSSIITEVRVTAHKYTEDPDGSIEIDGKTYADTQTVYRVANEDVTANAKSNVLKIEGANFVTDEIGQRVAQRVYDYYMKRDTAEGKILWRGELLGDCVTMLNAWNGRHTGNISRMDIILSNTVAASCEVIS